MSTLKTLLRYAQSCTDQRTANALEKILERTVPGTLNNAVTAYAGGGQTNAMALNIDSAFHNVTTVATAADSIKLPPAAVGEFHFVKNSAAASMQVFGSGTDTIDSVATATGVPQAAGDGVLYFCVTNGNYLRVGGIDSTEIFTTLTVNTIAGGTTPLAINGQAAGQGGTVAITGGTSSTGGNAGGPVVLAGGAPGTNANGGAVTISPAAGNGSGNGGAFTVVTGAAGATGVAGALNLAVGAATAGAGSAVTITAGSGAGGTAAGGNVNLVSGAAVSTGVPGEIRLNGSPIVCHGSYFFTGTPAATNQVFFIATRACRIQSLVQVHSTAAGGVSTLTVTKDTGTTAPGAGTVVQTGSFNLNATANTVQTATLSTTVATITMAAGDRLSVVFANAIQSSAGVVVTVGLSAA